MVNDKPKIIISAIKYPKDVEFGQDYTLSFSLKKDSFSIPQNVSLSIIAGSFSQKWQLGSLEQNRDITISMNSNRLDEGLNKMLLKLDYQDDFGDSFANQEDSSISLQNVNFFQKILIFLNKLASSLHLYQ